MRDGHYEFGPAALWHWMLDGCPRAKDCAATPPLSPRTSRAGDASAPGRDSISDMHAYRSMDAPDEKQLEEFHKSVEQSREQER